MDVDYRVKNLAGGAVLEGWQKRENTSQFRLPRKHASYYVQVPQLRVIVVEGSIPGRLLLFNPAPER